MTSQRTYSLVSSKNVFLVSILVILLTILGVFVFGLGRHSTFFENSILSTTILSIAFFLFVTVGLYRGIKLKEDIGRITASKVSFSDSFDVRSFPDLDIGEGIGGVIMGILLWIVAGLLLSVALWLLQIRS